MDEAVYNRGGGACLTPNDEAQIPAMHVRAAVFHATSLFQHHQPWLTCTTSSTSPNQRRPEAIQQNTTPECVCAHHASEDRCVNNLPHKAPGHAACWPPSTVSQQWACYLFLPPPLCRTAVAGKSSSSGSTQHHVHLM